MGRGLNKVMIIGYLGRDPEMRYTPSGRPVTSFSVATSRTWTSAEGERREETEWFNVVAWGTLAEICKSVKTSRFILRGACKHAVGKTNQAKNISVLNWLPMR